MRILVVDDEPDVIESVQLGLTLQWREMEVLSAHDGETALDMCAAPGGSSRSTWKPPWTSTRCAFSGPGPWLRRGAGTRDGPSSRPPG